MSLPAFQQRVINHMEGALRSSEPQLAAMFAVFAQLNEHQPVRAESLRVGLLRRWLAPGSATYAILLLPLTFIVVIIAAVLSGSVSNAATCEVGYSVGGGASALSRATCPAMGRTTVIPTTSHIRSTPCAASPLTGSADPAARSAPAAPFVTRTASEQALSPPSQPEATTKDPSRVC